MFRRPAFGLAELSWRWSFGVACWLLLTFTIWQYLDTLPVTSGDLLLLDTRNPVLILEAIAHIFRGSGFRFVETMLVLVLALAIGWMFVGAVARGAAIKSMLADFAESALATAGSSGNSGMGALLGLNFLRFAATLAAAMGCVAAFLLARIVSPASNPAPGSAFLVFLTVLLLVWMAWSVLNWFLSLAAIFTVMDGQSSFSSLLSAVTLCRQRSGSVLAVGTWFGLGHIAAFVLASSVAGFLLGLAAFLPPGIVACGLVLVTLLYLAVVDFLYAGRLAGYIAILKSPEQSVSGARIYPELQPGAAVDRDELILSDLPQQA